MHVKLARVINDRPSCVNTRVQFRRPLNRAESNDPCEPSAESVNREGGKAGPGVAGSEPRVSRQAA